MSLIKLNSPSSDQPIYLDSNIEIISLTPVFNGTEINYSRGLFPQITTVANSPDEIVKLFNKKEILESPDIVFCETDDEWYYKLSVKDVLTKEDRGTAEGFSKHSGNFTLDCMISNSGTWRDLIGKKLGEQGSYLYNFFYRKIPFSNLDKFITAEQFETYKLIHNLT